MFAMAPRLIGRLGLGAFLRGWLPDRLRLCGRFLRGAVFAARTLCFGGLHAGFQGLHKAADFAHRGNRRWYDGLGTH